MASHNDYENSTDNLEPVEMDMERSGDDEDDMSGGSSSGEPHSERPTRLATTTTSTPTLAPTANDDNRHHYGNEGDGNQHHSEQRDADESFKHSKDYISSNVSTNSSNIVHITNISPTATLEQITTLFSCIGDIIDIAMYHIDESPELNFKVCFVEFSKHSSALTALHLTNTIFIDRALFVLPYNKLKIPPDKDTAIANGYGVTDYVSRFNEGVSTQVATGPGGAQVITTSDPRLTALGLQTYPQLPINTDPTRLEEIRRTLYIGNLDSTLSPEQVLKFFNDIGEVKYIRIAGDETQPSRFAFVEYTHQASIANALQYNGFVLGSRALKINHSNNPIVKPNIKLDLSDNSSKKPRDNRSSSREFGPRDSKRRSSGRRDRSRNRYYDRRVSPRDSRSRRHRSKDRDLRRRRSRSRGHSSRRSRSREDLSRRRSRSKDSRKRRSRSRSSERRTKHRSSRRR